MLFCRSRDRFVESSQQIEALVQRFARETPLPDVPMNPMGSGKVPLSYGKPSEIKVWGMLYLYVYVIKTTKKFNNLFHICCLFYRKLLAATFSCSHAGLKSLFLRLFALPAAMGLMWIFYSNVGDDAKGFYSKSAMIMNVLGLAYGAGVWVTISLCKIFWLPLCFF